MRARQERQTWFCCWWSFESFFEVEVEVEVERERGRVSVVVVDVEEKISRPQSLSHSLWTHSVHRKLPGGLVDEHQDLEQQVIGQVGEAKDAGRRSGEVILLLRVSA